MKKLLALILTVLMMVALFVGCAPAAEDSADKPVTGEPSKNEDDSDVEVLRIGVCDALTGSGAAFGVYQTYGTEYAAHVINKAGGVEIGNKIYKIKLVEYDNESDATVAMSAASRLIDEDGVQYILGWGSSGATLPVVTAYADSEVSFLIGNARSLAILCQGTTNAWRSCLHNSFLADPYVDFMVNNFKDLENIAILGQFADATYQDHYNSLVNAIEKAGLNVSTTEVFNVGDRDMNTQVTNILRTDFDCVYLNGNVEELAYCLRQLREQGYIGPVVVGSGGAAEYKEICTDEQLANVYNLRPLGATRDECEFLGGAALDFCEGYAEYFGEDPDQTSVYGYDNLWILIEAMKQAGSVEWADVNDALADINIPKECIMPYELTNGKVFDEYHQAYAPLAVFEFKNGTFECINVVESGGHDVNAQPFVDYFEANS